MFLGFAKKDAKKTEECPTAAWRKVTRLEFQNHKTEVSGSVTGYDKNGKEIYEFNYGMVYNENGFICDFFGSSIY